MPVSLLEQPKLKALSAQVSSNKQTGFMLVDASHSEPIGQAKGLFADVEPVRSMCLNLSAHLKINTDNPLFFLAQQLAAGVFTLANSSVVMKMEHGRITSLYDVKLE
jgi:hypothetical protein